MKKKKVTALITTMTLSVALLAGCAGNTQSAASGSTAETASGTASAATSGETSGGDCCASMRSEVASAGTAGEASGTSGAAAETSSDGALYTGDVDYTTLSDEELNALYEQEPESKKTINISYSGGLCTAPVALAQLNGLYEAEGLDTKLIAVTDQRDGLAAGKIDTAIGMLTDWLPSIQNGVDIKFTEAIHTGCTSAAVLADSDITGFEKGQKIGVVGAIGGIYYNIGSRFITHDGFQLEDFSWLPLDEGTILASLTDGKTDVIVASDQLIQQWVNDGTVRRIRSQSDDDFKNEACCSLGFTGKFIEENPVTAFKITRAVYKAALWIQESDENKTEAVQKLLDNDYISGDVDFNVQLLKQWRYDLNGEDLEHSLRQITKEMVDLHILKEDTDVDAFQKQVLLKYNLGNIKLDDA